MARIALQRHREKPFLRVVQAMIAGSKQENRLKRSRPALPHCSRVLGDTIATDRRDQELNTGIIQCNGIGVITSLWAKSVVKYLCFPRFY